MSEEFKVGQTVWARGSGAAFEIDGVYGDFLWGRYGREDQPATRLAAHYTAVGPDRPAEPVPQKCPKCGGKTEMGDGLGAWRYIRCRGDCRMNGPLARNGLEAVQAWNSIRVGDVKCAECRKAPADPLDCFCNECSDHLAADCRAEERDACAKIAYLAAQKCGEGFGGMILANDIARDILKRGQQ